MADLTAVQQTIYRCARALDEHDLETFRGFWTSDATNIVSRGGTERQETLDQLLDRMERSWAEPGERTRHCISNTDIERADDGEIVVVSNVALLATGADGLRVAAAGGYRDVLVHDGERLLFRQRTLTIDAPSGPS
jgi:3-phenylpropionate/cinnamic acid dioxygenase small subunit